jgi:hypothetical protein
VTAAAFTIEGSATTDAIAVAAGATVDLALVSITGVRTVVWSIIGGSDDTKTAPIITPGGSPLGATATFTMTTPVGAAGVGWLVRCVVNGGKDEEGSVVAALTHTGVVGVNNSNGYVPFVYGELHERSPTHGVAPDWNEQLVLAGFGGEPMPAGTVDGSTIRWDTGGAEWVESTTLIVDEPAGIVTARRESIGTGAAAGLVVHNPTASGAGAPQYSPGLVLQGEGWETTGGTRREVYARTQVRGIEGASVTPTWALALGSAAEGTTPDAASLTDVLSVTPSLLTLASGALDTPTAWVLNVAGAPQLNLSATTADFQNNAITTTGNVTAATAVLSGNVTLANTSVVTFDSDPTGTPVIALRLDTGEQLLIGADGANGPENIVYQVKTGQIHRWFVGSTAQVHLGASVFEFSPGIDTNFALFGNGEAMIGLDIAASGVRNLALFNDGSAAMQSMDGGVYIANAVVVPTGNATNGGFLYVNAGALEYRGTTELVFSAGLSNFDLFTGVTLRQTQTSANTIPAIHNFRKSRSGGAVQANDSIGALTFDGHDGTSFVSIAGLNVVVDAAVSTGVVPMAVQLYTGSSSAFLASQWGSNGSQTHNTNAASTSYIFKIDSNTEVTFNDTVGVVLASGRTVDFGLSDALGGGASATLGTIGGSGPATAGQALWLEVKIGGTTHWIPAWV